MKNKDGVIRIGGVGTGRIYKHAHLRAYPEFLDKAWGVGFYDAMPGRAQVAMDAYKTRLTELAAQRPDLEDAIKANLAELTVHDSIDSLLEQVDLIDICTHARGRMPSAIAAFNKDVSAMAEKPMARTWSEVDRAIRAKQKHPAALFQLNDDNAFEPKYRMIGAAIDRGEIGKIQHVTIIRGSGTAHKTVLKAQATGLENGGGCLMDYGTHGLAGIMTIFGRQYRPTTVQAVQIATLYPHRILEDEPFYVEVDDNAQLKILMEDTESGSWATVFLEATYSGGHISLYQPKPGGQAGGVLEIVGDRGVITTAEEESFTIKYFNGGQEVIPLAVYEGETISVQTEMNSMFDAIRSGTDPELDLSFGADNIATVGAAYLSQVRDGTAVTLDEFKEFSKGFVKKYGDTEEADDAIVSALLEPYKRRG